MKNGTKASSVKSVQMNKKGCGGLFIEMPEMICNKPFLFIIKNQLLPIFFFIYNQSRKLFINDILNSILI